MKILRFFRLPVLYKQQLPDRNAVRDVHGAMKSTESIRCNDAFAPHMLGLRQPESTSPPGDSEKVYHKF